MKRLAVLATIFLASVAAAQDFLLPPPPIHTWLVDTAKLLEPFEADLVSRQLTTIERDTGSRVAVLTVAKTHELPRLLALRAINTWRLGRSSVLLLVIVEPRELYIQAGDDLGATFDRTTCESICRNVIAPHLAIQDRAGAFRLGLDAIAEKIRARASPPPPPANLGPTYTPRPLPPIEPPPSGSDGSTVVSFIVGVSTIAAGVAAIVVPFVLVRGRASRWHPAPRSAKTLEAPPPRKTPKRSTGAVHSPDPPPDFTLPGMFPGTMIPDPASPFSPFSPTTPTVIEPAPPHAPHAAPMPDMTPPPAPMPDMTPPPHHAPPPDATGIGGGGSGW